MYNQEVMSRRRSVHSYNVTSAGNRRPRSYGQEKTRLLQLVVCLVLFFAVFLWKGIFPQKLSQVRDDLLTLITTDMDIQDALAELGASLAESDSVLSDLGAFCVEVFGTVQEEEPTEPIPVTLPPESALMEELRFLSQGKDITAYIVHYTDSSKYGLAITPPKSEPASVPDEVPPVEADMAAPPIAIPAAGTVVAISDYSGEALPNNYTMDQLSLGELETVTPVMGHLNSEYGYRDHPINGRYQFHGGVDIGGQNGDPIAAFASGIVEYIGEDDSYGQYFQIDHGNGVKSFYAHCSKVLVSKGQKVSLGEKVAEIGSSGSATGPHLHLELKYNKMHLNPIYYVDILEQE